MSPPSRALGDAPNVVRCVVCALLLPTVPHVHVQDGPALRATAMITYANWLLDNDNSTFVTNALWPIIKLDLDYVSQNWNQTTCVEALN